MVQSDDATEPPPLAVDAVEEARARAGVRDATVVERALGEVRVGAAAHGLGLHAWGLVALPFQKESCRIC